MITCQCQNREFEVLVSPENYSRPSVKPLPRVLAIAVGLAASGLIATLVVATFSPSASFESLAQDDIPPDVDGPSGQSDDIGDFDAEGSFEYQSDGIWRNQ